MVALFLVGIVVSGIGAPPRGEPTGNSNPGASATGNDVYHLAGWAIKVETLAMFGLGGMEGTTPACSRKDYECDWQPIQTTTSYWQLDMVANSDRS